MSRYEKAAAKAKAEQEFIQEQKLLRKKYQEPENIIIKEKSNMTKFIISTIKSIVQTTATILLFILSTIGIITLIYPNVRAEFMSVLVTIYDELSSMIR